MKTHVGMNLTEVNYWTNQPFMNRNRSGGDWAAQGAPTEPLPLNAADEPTKFPAGATTIYRMVGMDTPGAVFELLYDGAATFKLAASTAAVISSEPGRIVFRYVGSDPRKPQMQLPVKSGVPTNIRIVRQDQLAAFNSGEVFRPEFVDRLRGFAQLRFMDAMQTNGSLRTTALIEDDGGTYRRGRGAPLPVCLALAAAAGSRAWVNVPVHISDESLIKAAMICPPGTLIEWGNEIWNRDYEAGVWVEAQAKDARVSKRVWIAQQQARRAKLLQPYGRKLLAGYQQSTNADAWAEYGDALIAAGATRDNVSGITTTGYINGNLNWQLGAKVQPLRAYMERNDRAGVHAAMMKEVREVSGLRFKLAQDLSVRLDVPWFGYEANAHLNMDHGVKDEFTSFVESVQTDPGIRPVFEELLKVADEYGCECMNFFNLGSPPSMKGFYGVEGLPLGELLDEIRTAPPPAPPAPRSTDDRLAALEADVAMLKARI